MGRRVYSAGIYEYWILPEFFKQPGRGLDNTVVFSECCKAMGKEGNVDASMANALVSGAGATSVVAFHNSVYANYSRNILHYFVNRLLAGDTAEEALAAAKSKYGADDGHEVNAAYGILTGKRDARLINVGLQNDSFEKASYAAGWSTVGDVRIISKLGDLQPLDGSRMALLTTGIGSKEQAYLEGTEGSILSQKFIVPQNATTLTFRYDVISEEPMEFVNSQFDDKFLVEIRDQSGDSLDNRTVETINTSYWYQLDGAKYNFEGGDDTVYHTNWKTFSVDVSQWRGKLIELRFIVFDVGDSVYDTATLVDNVKVA